MENKSQFAGLTVHVLRFEYFDFDLIKTQKLMLQSACNVSLSSLDEKFGEMLNVGVFRHRSYYWLQSFFCLLFIIIVYVLCLVLYSFCVIIKIFR